jgi:hypothetical protein
VGYFRAVREATYLGIVLSSLGYAHRARGETSLARVCLVEVLEMGVATGAAAALASALPGMAMLYADAGQPARALTLVTVVKQCCPMVAGSEWFTDIAGPAYHAGLAALTSEEAAEAEGRGLVSDMQTEAQAILAELAVGNVA